MWGLLMGGLILCGAALAGVQLFEHYHANSPVMKWNPEDIPVRKPGPMLPVEPQPEIFGTVLSSGILEEIIHSDKLLAEYRMERQRLRGQEVSTLQEIIDSSDAESPMREQAAARLITVMEREEQEVRIEYLLKSTGIPDCVVMLEEGSATILLPEMLSEAEVERLTAQTARLAALEKGAVSIVMREKDTTGETQEEENEEE